MADDVRIRLATTSDLAEIERIECACFGSPWLRDVYEQELERDVSLVEVAEDDRLRLVGFSCSWFVTDEAHLMRIATDPRVRRSGIGRRLLTSVAERAASAGCETLTLEVAATNTPAIGLYREMGFGIIGHRAGYYTTPPDDALVMRRPLRPAAAAAGDERAHPGSGRSQRS